MDQKHQLLINEVSLGSNDIIVLHVPIGNLPPTKANEFVDKIVAKYKEKFPNEVIAFASRGEYQMTIVHRD